jgi:hypothetical protein
MDIDENNLLVLTCCIKTKSANSVAMKPFKRKLLIIGLTIVGIYLLLLIALGISPSVKDSDLQFTRVPLPAESNCYDLLVTAHDQMWIPDGEMFKQFSQVVSDTNWNSAFAAQVLQRNKEALATLYQALALPALQLPPPREIGETTGEPFLNIKPLASLLAVRGNALFHEGKEKEAFKEALKIVRMGALEQDSGGDCLTYILGSGIKSVGIQQMQRWVLRTRLTAEELIILAQQLQPFEPSDTALGNAFKCEYKLRLNYLAKLRAGVLKGGYFEEKLISKKLLPVFNFGKTKRMFANHTRALVAAAGLPYNEANYPYTNKPSNFALICSGNCAGEVQFWLMRNDMEQLIPRKCHDTVAVRLTRTALALRAYKLKNGRLPPTLETLVPEYLDSVPVDDFDGQDMRYSPERKIVYSVSKNLTDDDGTMTNKAKTEPDQVFTLSF